jgi:NAD(P)-dependent dehydrogenase (short-subunit alcohol dehydrogenase family)
MELGLAGKRVLITGASKGIGRALAYAFAEEGCDLYLVARSEAELIMAASDIEAKHSVRVETLAADITAPGAVDAIAARADDIDVLINNAGAIPGGDLWDIDARRWRDAWSLKVFGYIDLTRAIYPMMKARGAGAILNNIGNGGENFDFDYIAGSTGNAALMAFTRCLGGRSLEDGIRVIGVNPGPVATERLLAVLESAAATGRAPPVADRLRRYPLGRPAELGEITALFLFLASHRSTYTSGTIVTVDGGLTSKRSI